MTVGRWVDKFICSKEARGLDQVAKIRGTLMRREAESRPIIAQKATDGGSKVRGK